MSNREKYTRGLLDTSVIIDLVKLRADDLPAETVVSAFTFAEMAAGPHAAASAGERAQRQEELQRLESAVSPVPFGVSAARAYGRVYAAAIASGRKARGARTVDLMIAATALAEGLPLFTRNPRDFAGLDGIVEVVAV